MVVLLIQKGSEVFYMFALHDFGYIYMRGRNSSVQYLGICILVQCRAKLLKIIPGIQSADLA